MIVACQEPGCDVALLVEGVTFAPEHRIICTSCAAEKVFGGKDDQGGTNKPAVQSLPGVPANPGGPTVDTTTVNPSNASGDSFPLGRTTSSTTTYPPQTTETRGRRARWYGGACRVCGATAYVPFEPPEPLELLEMRGRYLCNKCYKEGRR